MNRRFTTEDDDFLKDNYLTMSKNAMGKKIGRAIGSVVCRMVTLNLKVPDVITEQFITAALFKQGDNRLRRGKRKGSSVNEKTLWIARNGKLYYWIKTQTGWVQLHNYLWRQAGNTIPPGHVVVFKNNNPLKCKLDNLECITRAESLARNQLINWTNKRSKKSLAERRSEKYFALKDEQLLKRSKIFQRQQAALLKLKQKEEVKNQQSIIREKNRQRKKMFAQQLSMRKQAEKKLSSVRMKDEINWSKKVLNINKMKIADSSNLIPVRVDHKTIVYVKPGADIPTILKQYQKKAS